MGSLAQIIFLLLAIELALLTGSGSAQQPPRRHQPTRSRNHEKLGVMKDAFLEDNSFVVRIRTIYNHSSSATCNGILMEEQLVLSDVTCIKYNNMANIDAKYVQVIAGGENANETYYEVEQIYLNKADPRDPGTELALLKLSKPIRVDTQCRSLIRPEKNHSIEAETAVRVIGYTHWFELKENRTRVTRKPANGKYICTTPADINETPGSQLLKGAPLLHMIDCKQYQLVGIYTSTIETSSPSNSKKHQDCYVLVSSQMRWYEQVRSLSALAAKNDGGSSQPSVIVVTVDDDKDPETTKP